jgi:L-amino acid N-acyltransferase YncA
MYEFKSEEYIALCEACKVLGGIMLPKHNETQAANILAELSRLGYVVTITKGK